jgi:hypothetical protein
VDVYEHAGAQVTQDPRRNQEYKGTVLEGSAFGKDVDEKYPGFNQLERAAARETLARKAAAF